MVIWLPSLSWTIVVYRSKKKFLEHPRLMVIHLMKGQNRKMKEEKKRRRDDVVINTVWGVTLKSRETFN